MAKANPKSEEERLRAELARTKTALRVMTDRFETAQVLADEEGDMSARMARRVRQLKRVLERHHIDVPPEIIDE